MRQIREILRLHHEVHLGERQIAAICLVGKGTVQRFLQRAAAVGLGWPLPEDLDDSQLERLLFPPVPAPAGTRPQPDFTKIHQELKSNRSVTLQLLWEEYKESQPEGINYSWFCDQYRDWSRHLDVVLRQDHRAGEKMFVDHAGDTIDIIHPATGEARAAYIFVAVLGASNYTYAEATWTRDLTDWIGSHTRALQYFQGVTKLVVPDQWRSGVSRPCYWEPELNRTYQDWAMHNGVAIVPARPRHARDKAKVEQGVLLTQRWVVAVLRKRQFFSLGQLNEAIRELLAKLNQKPFRKLPGTRAELYEKLDRPALANLPPQPYVFAQWKKIRVGLDYHVDVEGHHYSTPYQLVGQQVEARYTVSTVEILYRGKRVASHPRSSEVPGHSTEPAHRPKSHQRYLEWNPTRLLEWAGTIGLFTVRFVEGLLTNHPHPEAGFRAGMGLRPLARQYGEARLESACTLGGPLQAVSPGERALDTDQWAGSTTATAVGARRPAVGARQHPRRRLLCGGRLRGGGRMMIEQTLDKLRVLRLSGMVEAYRQQTENPDVSSLSFEERLGLMVDQHWTWRENKALARRLKTSRLETEPCVEDINYRYSRQLDGAKLRSLLSCEWVTQHLAVIFTGPTGIGKSWLSQALAHKACRDGFSVLYRPAGKLFRELGEARVDGSLGKLLPSLARVDVLVVDDFAMNPLEEHERRLFLEICDDRYRRRSTVLSSQLPVASWHKQIGDPTIADSILDRLVHSAYRFELDGESIRKKQGGRP